MGINYKNLLEGYRADKSRASAYLKEGLREKSVKPTDFDFGRLFVECFGWNEFVHCREKNRLAHQVMEASGAVTTASFQDISQQIVYSAILEYFEAPEFVFTKLIPTVSTKFKTERIPGITGIGDETQVVKEGDPYPIAGVGESWIDTPLTAKRGMIVPVTREAVFFDRTGVLLDRCSKVGYWHGYNKELRAINCVIDENAGAVSALIGGHRYFFKGNSIATYADNSGNHNWDNLQATNTLLDYTSLENAELLLSREADPDLGIVTGSYRAAAQQLVCTTQLVQTAKRIINATEIRVAVGGFPTTGNPLQTTSPNVQQNYQIVSSALLEVQLGVDTSWFLGNIGKAFRWMENWPMETPMAPSSNHDEFHRDIVQQYKVSEMGAYATFDPRYVVKSTVA